MQLDDSRVNTSAARLTPPLLLSTTADPFLSHVSHRGSATHAPLNIAVQNNKRRSVLADQWRLQLRSGRFTRNTTRVVACLKERMWLSSEMMSWRVTRPSSMPACCSTYRQLATTCRHELDKDSASLVTTMCIASRGPQVRRSRRRLQGSAAWGGCYAQAETKSSQSAAGGPHPGVFAPRVRRRLAGTHLGIAVAGQ